MDNGNGTTSSPGEFGKSEYGDRLVYVEQGCCVGWRDRWWAVFYYIQVAIIVVLAFIYWTNLIPGHDKVTPSPTFVPAPTVSVDIDWGNVGKSLSPLLVSLLVQMVVGSAFGLLWLKIIQMFAEQIIRTMLFLMVFLWIVVVILGFIENSTGLIVIGIIFTLISGLWVWCSWDKVPFTSALVKISSIITQTFEGTICISLCSIPMNICWFFLWMLTFIGYFVYAVILEDGGASGFIVFLLLISYYWGCQVNKNVPHTTSCGVSANWYFSKGALRNPTMPALKRTMTTSFGSVCFGSFIVALIQAVKAMLRSQSRTPLACIALCILACIERLFRYFNSYAFAQCAIYGTSYVESAKRTMSLFLSKGFSAIINDHLTGLALSAGSFLAFVTSGFIGYLICYAMYSDAEKDTRNILSINIGIIGGLCGFYLCRTILQVIESSIVCLFVCFAEDPNALKENRPEEYNMLITAKAEMNTYVTTGHTGVYAKGEEPQQQQQQQQPQ